MGTSGFPPAVVHSVGLDKCKMMRVHCCRITQGVFTTRKALCAPSILASLPCPLSATDHQSLSHLRGLAFPSTSWSWNRAACRLSDCHPLCRDLHLEFLYAFVWLEALFIFSGEYPIVLSNFLKNPLRSLNMYLNFGVSKKESRHWPY